MEVITLNGVKIAPNTVAAIGFFDGVHKAHQTLIKTMLTIAEQHHKEKAIITFDVHPKSVLFELDYNYITPLKKKLEIFETFGVDKVYLIEFTKDKARLEPDEFIDNYLTGLDELVCGFDFKFGTRGSGNVGTIKAHPSIKAVIVDELTYDGYKIGSTHIRDLIMSGQVHHIKETMGRHYSITGEVIHGANQGRGIGYPTANIDTGDYLIPKKGVYASFTKVKGVWHPSMSSIGHNPTLNCQTNISVESYIFDFDEQIYGEVIEILFIERLRDEQKFSSVDALVAQIDEDGHRTLEILKNSDFTLR
ncbi:MAG: bifunctional riboflavin kinase/FAD synthetase [Bacillota bacterium]